MPINADDSAGSKVALRVSGSASDVQHAAGGQEARAQCIAGGVPVPTGVKAAFSSDDAFTGKSRHTQIIEL